MDFSYLFEPYNALVVKADQGFQSMESEFAECIKCEPHCADCCHAVFGLFLIEAVFLKHDFDQLGDAEKSSALKRGDEANREFEKLARSLEKFKDDPRMMSYSMARARIRCPLLSDNNACILYPYRPITCRVYGIPCMIKGVPRVCGRAGFKKGQSYPTFNLDGVHQELYHLSRELLKKLGEKDLERASLLISVSKVIQMPLEELPHLLNNPGMRE